jgi:hypothetical protein
MAQHVTFWRMKVQPGKVDQLRALMGDDAGDEARLRDNGFAMSLVGQRKDDPEEVWGCVTWDTSERYYANAASPEQNAQYEKVRALLAEDPQWFDCDVLEDQRA